MGRLYFNLHENHKNKLNVGEYTSPMDGMGYGEPPFFFANLVFINQRLLYNPFYGSHGNANGTLYRSK